MARRTRQNYGLSIAVFTAVGTAIGFWWGEVEVGMALGIVFGALVGFVRNRRM